MTKTQCVRSLHIGKSATMIGMAILLSYAALGHAPQARAAATATVSSPFIYNFSVAGSLAETGSMQNSSSPYFWLNSGGRFTLKEGTGRTVSGALSANDPWRLAYNLANALDTDDGYHPQNLFRLLTRSSWRNAETKLSFRINGTNLTSTPNRDGYSGVLLFSRYTNEDNLYYAGLRQDGSAVIKKKRNGSYSTLGSAQVFGTASAYDRDTNPNLIPQHAWMRLKLRTFNQPDGSVTIDLYLDRENDGSYAKVLSATDWTGALRDSGHVGVRTDYMDVEFDSLVVTRL
jgi:hypothetical protein